MEDASANKHTFAYDKLNRLTSETDAYSESIVYDYDDAGRLVSIVDREGRERVFGYDDANRRTSEAWYSAGNSLLQTQTFGYDDAGFLVSATDPDGDYTIVRDELNRAEEVETPSGVTLTFAYDGAGNRTSVADSKGGTQTSTFDLANRLTSRKLDGPSGDLRFDYNYTDRDELATVTRFSDLTGTTQEGKSSYAYDDGGRLVDIEHRTGSGAGTLIADYAYEYDLANRLTEKVEDSVTTTYSYDAIGQVTARNSSTISYDATGNRTLSGYVTADGNRMTEDGTWTYAHDLDGNVVGKSKTGEAWTYEYDLRGQMTEATDGTTTVTYAYDAFGNRIGRTETDGTTTIEAQYVVDGWDTTKPSAIGTENFDTILDLDGTGAVTDRRVFGAGFDEVVARQDAGGDVSWYATDRLGSVRQVFDNSGATSGETDYDAFGGFLGGVPVDRYAFTGREWDETLGLQYSRARMYDPSTGRWMGEDGIRQAGEDPNLYRYVGNGATNGVDPSGNYWIVDRPGDYQNFADFLNANGIQHGWVGDSRGQFLWINPNHREKLRQALLQYYSEDAVNEILDAAIDNRSTHHLFAGGNPRGGLVQRRYDNIGTRYVDYWMATVDREQGITGPNAIDQFFDETEAVASDTAERAIRFGKGFIDEQKMIIEYAWNDPKGFIDNAKEGLGEGFENFGQAVKEMVNETAELVGKIITDPKKFALELAEAIYLLATDERVREAMKNEFLKDWKENPSKAFIKAGLSVLCGSGAGKVMSAVKTLMKAKAAKILKKLKAGNAGPIAEQAAMDLAEAAGKTTDPKQLEKINRALDDIERTNGQAALGSSLAEALTGCFVAGTPILTPNGPRPIEDLQPGDLVYSACEDDPDCTVGVQVIQQAIRSVAPAWTVRIGGQTLRMTSGHPLYVRGRGWQPLHELNAGVEVRGKDGDYRTIDAIEQSDVPEVVYNIEVGEYHTFFVGGAGWDFAIWVHNERLCNLVNRLKLAKSTKEADDLRTEIKKRLKNPCDEDKADLKNPELAKQLWDQNIEIPSAAELRKLPVKQKGIKQSQKAQKDYDKLTDQQKKAHDEIVNDLTLGKAGRNQHPLTGDRKGQFAADLPGSGGGRGRMRIVYTITDDTINVIEIVDYH